MTKPTVVKMTILFPTDLYNAIETLCEDQERSFSKQIIFMLKHSTASNPRGEPRGKA